MNPNIKPQKETVGQQWPNKVEKRNLKKQNVFQDRNIQADNSLSKQDSDPQPLQQAVQINLEFLNT